MNSIGSVCRCICSGYWEVPEKTASMHFDEEPAFTPSPIEGKITYSINTTQPLRGVPIREGNLFYIAAEDKVDYVTFSLYINGFAFTKVTGGEEMSVSLSPFALVRNCRFQSQVGLLHDFKIFKISMFPKNVCYYFGVRDEEERSRWVLDLSHTMRVITQSVFPPFRIRTAPLDGVPLTHRRLMAGYLLHIENEAAALVYCELHAHFAEQAKFILYENESCKVATEEILVTDTSICCEKVGINCSCFCIDDHVFSSRTLSERKLWLRAFSNVKVKVQNRAPTPTSEQLKDFRNSISEHLTTLMERVQVPLQMDALLQRKSSIQMEPIQIEMPNNITSYAEPL